MNQSNCNYHETEEQLIKQIDCFLQYFGINTFNLTMLQRKKYLKRVKEFYQNDFKNTEYFLGLEEDSKKQKELQYRMDADNMLIREINQCQQQLPSISILDKMKRRK